MKNHLKILIISFLLLLLPINLQAASFSSHLIGRILLQVEENGEAWYVYPSDLQRYYLGRPADAFEIMRNFGLGITNVNLEKIPIGLTSYDDIDSDNDGLIDLFEDAIGSDKNLADTDFDGFSDYTEVSNGYKPNNGGLLTYDYNLVNSLKGKILLQVEGSGEAWYVNPADSKRYFLARPTHAFQIMRSLGLGITNTDLNNIPIGSTSIIPETSSSSPSPAQPETVEPVEVSYDVGVKRNELFNLVNDKRQSLGLSLLNLETRLTNAAQAHAQDMADRNYFSLTDPDGKTITDRVLLQGYNANELWVNIARGSDDANSLFSSWYSDPSTKNTIVSAGIEDIGIGVVFDSQGTYWELITASDLDKANQEVIDSLNNLSAVRNEMLSLVNQERANVGLEPLVFSSILNNSAQDHALDMRDRNFYNHVNPDGEEPADRIIRAGYNPIVAGENIAMNQTSVAQVMEGWMNSEHHRDNILYVDYTEIGIGLSYIVREGELNVYWVQNFGRPH